MTNDLSFVNNVIRRLKAFEISAILFGGWAKELNGMINPRKHVDVDLLLFANDFTKVDAFIRINNDVTEILAKRYFHKRAFLLDGIMVEIILIKVEENELTTEFWGEFKMNWPYFIPLSLATNQNRKLLVAPPEILEFYTNNFRFIEDIRKKSLAAA